MFSLFIVGTMGDAISQKTSVCGGKLRNKLKHEELFIPLHPDLARCL